jgi:hypothetical protein
MTKQYDDTNRGALFKNDRATTDKHPNLTGKINVEGREYYISGWTKIGKKGKYISVSVKPVDEDVNRVERFQQAVKASFPGDDDDYIPFAPEWR